MKSSALNRDTEKARAFVERGRRSSAESLKATDTALARNGRSVPRRMAISPASKAQRAKVAEMGYCVACHAEGVPLDPAHLVDRSLGGCDHRDCVVPLCRRCHDAYDGQTLPRLDLLPILERREGFRREQAHAVLHLGVAAAFERLTGYGWRRAA